MMTPKARFLSHPTEVAIHKSLVVSPPFLDAVDSALQQLVHSLAATPANDTLAASAAYNKIAGAVEFKTILLTLADTPTIPAKAPDRSNLKPV